MNPNGHPRVAAAYMTPKTLLNIGTGFLSHYSHSLRLGIRSIYEQLGLESWYSPDAYRIVYERLLQVFPKHQVFLSQEGFAP